MSDKAKSLSVQIQNVAGNPDMAKGTVGGLVLDMMQNGEEISRASIIAELEAIAAGKSPRDGFVDVLAAGALKVIADLPPR